MLSSRRHPSVQLQRLERALAVALVVAACALCSQRHSVDAKPSFGFSLKAHDEAPTIAADNACYHDGQVEELCQRCAKVTKSNLVYPMCCEDKEEAREWCGRYLNIPPS